MRYHVPRRYVWDSWYFSVGDEVHCIHMQKRRGDGQLIVLMVNGQVICLQTD